MRTLKSDDFIEFWLGHRREELEKILNSDAIILRSPMTFGVDDIIRNIIENINDGTYQSETEDRALKRDKLTVVIETNCGSIEVVERIYAVFRKYYLEVDFIVPNFAYSAGTVLVLSGDNIYMDYYSVLGPIDPQVEGHDGRFVPGIGYLDKFNELTGKINSDPENTKAELAYLIKKFDPAMLFYIEQARNHSQALLKEWLPKHKFKNWEITETHKVKVDENYKRDRANKIAEILGDPSRWHSHGRGIGIKELTSDEIKLMVRDLGSHHELNTAVKEYYDLFVDYCSKRGTLSAIHSRLGFRRLS